jgi:hypothetical protein
MSSTREGKIIRLRNATYEELKKLSTSFEETPDDIIMQLVEEHKGVKK